MLFTASFGIFFSVTHLATAQTVTTNITPTLGIANLGTVVLPRQGNVININGGTVKTSPTGSNLFHSFGEFNLGTGDIASFNNTTSVSNIANIISRVTGENPSYLFGTMRSTIEGANFFFMNPRGIVFGPEARLEMSGATYFTTANHVTLTDGVKFDMTATADVLTSMPVASFGFLGPDAASIYVQGSTLLVAESQALGLIGGERPFVGPDGALVPSGVTTTAATLSAPSGQLHLVSVASAGEATLPADGAAALGVASFSQLGRVGVSGGSTLDVSTPVDLDGFPISANGGGTVSIRGGQFVLDASTILANTLSSGDGAQTAVSIVTTGDTTVTNGSLIFSHACFAFPCGTGRTGDIQFSGQNVLFQNGSALFTATATDAPTVTPNLVNPVGGNVSVEAERFELTGGSIINTDSAGLGVGGTVSIRASDHIRVAGFDPILGTESLIATFETGSVGKGGAIELRSPRIAIEDLGSLFTEGASRRSGAVSLYVDDLAISRGGRIATLGGDISIRGFTGENAATVKLSGFGEFARESRIDVTGGGTEGAEDSGAGTISVNTAQLFLTDDARINSEANLLSGGLTSISATDSIVVENGAKIRMGGGNGGLLEISAPTILLDRGSLQTTAGPALVSGPITVSTSTITLRNGGQILSGELGLSGPTEGGGNVVVQGLEGPLSSADSVLITGRDGAGNSSGIISATSGALPGGKITISAVMVTVEDNATLNSTTSGLIPEATGGDITLTAGQSLMLRTGASVTASTTGEGHAGNIAFRSSSVALQNGATVSATTSGAGNAGSVTIQGTASPAQSLTISGPGSGLFTETQGTGAGGNITTWANQLQLTNGATISSKTTGQMPGAGDAGNILVKADDITISGGATITASSTGTGNAGTVTIQGTNSPAQSLLITGAGSGVFTTTSGTGTGGDILARSDSVLLTNGGTLSAATSGTSPSAVGGTVGVVADTVRIENGGLVTAASSGPANGGDIAILAEQSVTVNSQGAVSTRATGAGNAGSIGILAGGDFLSGGGSVSTTAAQGTGGDILVAAGQDIRLADQASLSANSSGPGDAGNITALAGDDFVMQNSSITTQAAQASGGNIKIGAQDQIVLQNSLISASVQGGSGSGGNISIDPTVVVLQNSQVRANAVFGNGGNITITTPLFFADQTSIVDASSQFGVNGTVTIQSPTSNLAGTVASLPSSMRQAQSLQTGRCAALANSQSSSFVVAGRETVPAEPGGWLPSPFASLNAGERLGAQDNGEGLEVSGHGQRMRDEDVSGLSRASDQRRATNHMLDRADSIDQGDQVVLSLRRLTPAGFLTQSFAESGSTGCRS
jgi:filamentous hemagglutinin family protein